MAAELFRARLCAPLPVASAQAEALADLLERTVTLGESNSVLVSGPRGSGKTALVRAALGKLRETYKPPAFIEVHLDGLVLTDDRVALQEIAWQLAVEQQLEQRTFGSFADTLKFLLETLRKGEAAKTTPLIIVLNEFDQFALHPKQTLLYNLFDIVQSSNTGIAVVGVTARLDAIELLEKRVKSRFSHRHIRVEPLTAFDDYCTVLLNALTLPEGLPYAADFNHSVQALRKHPAFMKWLRSMFDTTSDIQILFQHAFMAVCRLPPEPKKLDPALFIGANADPKVELLLGVSILELALLIAMKNMVERKEQSTFNFEMVYKDYRDFVAKHSSVELYSKPVALKAFQSLLNLELIRPASGSAAAAVAAREFVVVTLHVDPSQLEDAMEQRRCPEYLKAWATKWVE